MTNQQLNRTRSGLSDQAWLFEEVGMSLETVDTVHYREMVEVSDLLMAGYARFVRRGMPREMVGFAMLGATMNLYDVFEMRAGLPPILRGLADRIEQTADC